MRIALETNALYTTQAGVARYIRGLIKGLHQLNRRDLEWFEFAWPVDNFSYQQPQRALKTFYRQVIWSDLLAPGLLRKSKADLLHLTCGSTILPPKPMKHVITLHDLAILRHPERFRKWQRYSATRRLALKKRAHRVICISQFTADEAISLINLAPGKIDIVYNGCDFHYSEPSPVESQPDFTVPSEFFLFVGSLEPGKNLVLLKHVYQLAREAGHSLPPLLIVGARWEGVGTEGSPPKDWRYLGRQPDGVLVHLYRRALALLFPSKYEGFGLPIVEAMALGCPVICSRVASLPEVGGEAAFYADLTPEAYLEAVRSIVSQPDLRRSLQLRGREQARKFSWKACAEGVLDVYRRAIGT